MGAVLFDRIALFSMPEFAHVLLPYIVTVPGDTGAQHFSGDIALLGDMSRR